MHAHPSDRFIGDSGATIMATGYVYARLRSRVLYHRVGMVCTSREAVSSIITIVFAAISRIDVHASPRLAPTNIEWISRATLPDLSPR